jgi:hypothetical protein
MQNLKMRQSLRAVRFRDLEDPRKSLTKPCDFLRVVRPGWAGFLKESTRRSVKIGSAGWDARLPTV